MKILKNVGIFFLLAVLTCCVVFGPQLLSGQSEDNILNTVVYRSYSTGNRPKPTGEQVARLYYNREISFEFNPSSLVREESEVETVRETVANLIEGIFKEDDALCRLLRTVLTGGASCLRTSCLVKIDSRPTALNFVSYSVYDGSGNSFAILYEEKTKTVVQLGCDVYGVFAEALVDRAECELYREKIAEMMKTYYELQLGLESGQYFFTVDLLGVEDDDSLVNVVLGCGLMRFEDGFMEQDEW